MKNIKVMKEWFEKSLKDGVIVTERVSYNRRRCFVCGELASSFIRVDFHPPLRGNENEFSLHFCKRCSISDPRWHEAKFEKRIEKLETELANERAKIEKLKDLL